MECWKNRTNYTLEFIISYPYSSNTSFEFPNCGILALENEEIYQEVNKATSASFSIATSFLGVIFAIFMIINIFLSESDVFYKKWIQNKDLAIVFRFFIQEMVLCAIFVIFYFISAIVFAILAINVRMVSSEEYFARYLQICNENVEIMKCSVSFTRFYFSFLFSIVFFVIFRFLIFFLLFFWL